MTDSGWIYGKDGERVPLTAGGMSYQDALSNTTAPYSSSAENAPPQLTHPKPNKFLKFGFRTLEVIAIAINVFVILNQVLPLLHHTAHRVWYRRPPPGSQMTFNEWLDRLYMAFFCGILILVEARAPLSYLRSHVLQIYLSRGVLYTYLGNAVFLQAATVLQREWTMHRGRYFVSWSAILLKLAGGSQFGLGLVYVTLSFCCMGHVRERVATGPNPAEIAKTGMAINQPAIQQQQADREEQDRLFV